MPYQLARVATLVAVTILVPGNAMGDLAGRKAVLTPQIIVPMGELNDIAGVGVGIGLEWHRPIDAELALVTTVEMLGFRRHSRTVELLSVESQIAMPAERETTGQYGVVAMPLLVGVKYRAPGFFVGLSVGDLFTRVEKTTRLRIGPATPANSVRAQATGTNSRPRHGPMISLSMGLEREDVSFAGLRLGFALGERGIEGRSNFSWLSIFVSI